MQILLGFFVVLSVGFSCAQDLRYTVFLVDDTGSMSEEIGAVKTWLLNCLAGKYPNCLSDSYVLMTFNDPEVGNVTGPTSNIEEIIEAVKKLEAHDGDDCPELRYEGMQIAVDAVPDAPLRRDPTKGRESEGERCKVFLFTDALAKDHHLKLDVEKSLLEKGCALYPLLTGCCGDCPDACESVSKKYCVNHVFDARPEEPKRKKRSAGKYVDIDELGGEDPLDSDFLYKLAEKTGGTIYITEKQEKKEFLEFLEKEVSFGFCPTDTIAGPLPDGYACEEDCVAKSMCWDKSARKCFCTKTACARTSLKQSKCDSRCKKNVPFEYVPNPKFCRAFSICVFGKKHEFICPEDKVFGGQKCQDPDEIPPPCGTLKVEG